MWRLIGFNGRRCSLKKPVAGIAMGMIVGEENTVVLSDIRGEEDFMGDMDFKTAG